METMRQKVLEHDFFIINNILGKLLYKRFQDDIPKVFSRFTFPQCPYPKARKGIPVLPLAKAWILPFLSQISPFRSQTSQDPASKKRMCYSSMGLSQNEKEVTKRKTQGQCIEVEKSEHTLIINYNAKHF